MNNPEANLAANRKVLEKINTHLHMLRQGILPPDIASQALMIFKSKDKAIAGMIKAREADKMNVEHIIAAYEKEQP
ncbi:hypothetical protein [Tetrasphaera phage TJE1]|uniref:Uncharacterized protein n=1 Tax=Tetrasphaera phage TJE1 TaxID=981335 RepID=G4W947_9CAUD|nr:hypothetical protein G185_gp05 [Tetrasphaera phage TJE1]ADX42535.1 hypothetical protein [Tetrasphaera phage TJE1]